MPNSFSQSLEATCQACRKTFEAQVWHIVDAEERPDLTERVRQGRLHRFDCPHCGQPFEAELPLVILRQHSKPNLIFSTSGLMDLEQIRQVSGVMISFLRSEMGPAWQDEWLTGGVMNVPRPALPAMIDQDMTGSTDQIPNAGETDEPTEEDHQARTAQVLVRFLSAFSVDAIRELLTQFPELLSKEAQGLFIRAIAQARENDHLYELTLLERADLLRRTGRDGFDAAVASPVRLPFGVVAFPPEIARLLRELKVTTFAEFVAAAAQHPEIGASIKRWGGLSGAPKNFAVTLLQSATRPHILRAIQDDPTLLAPETADAIRDLIETARLYSSLDIATQLQQRLQVLEDVRNGDRSADEPSDTRVDADNELDHSDYRLPSFDEMFWEHADLARSELVKRLEQVAREQPDEFARLGQETLAFVQDCTQGQPSTLATKFGCDPSVTSLAPLAHIKTLWELAFQKDDEEAARTKTVSWDRSITYLERVLRVPELATDPILHASTCYAIASVRYRRYFEQRHVDDLNRAIELLTRALSLLPPGSPRKSEWEQMSATLLTLRFDREGNLPDLEAALEMTERLIQADPGYIYGRVELGGILCRRFQLFDRMDDLERALELNQSSADALPEDSIEWKSLQPERLCACLLHFWEKGEIGDWECALQALDNIFVALASSRSLGWAWKETLNKELLQFPGLSKIIMKISDRMLDTTSSPLSREQVHEFLKDHPELAQELEDELGSLPHPLPPREFEKRYWNAVQADRKLNEVERTADSAQAAILAWNDILNDPQVERYPGFQAEAYSRLTPTCQLAYNATRALATLDSAVHSSRRALELARVGSPKCMRRQAHLGISLLSRFTAVRNPEDLDSAISALEQALGKEPSKAERSNWQCFLARVLLMRFASQKNPADLETAIELLKETHADNRSGTTPAILPEGLLELAVQVQAALPDPDSQILQDLERKTFAPDPFVHRPIEFEAAWKEAMRASENKRSQPSLQALEACIRLWQKVLGLPDFQHSDDRAFDAHSELCECLRERFLLTGRSEDLDDAVRFAQEVSRRTYPDPAQSMVIKMQLADALQWRFQIKSQTTDLDEAQSIYQELVTAFPDDLVLKDQWASILVLRSAQTGSMDTLETAIAILHNSIAQIESGDKTQLEQTYSPPLLLASTRNSALRTLLQNKDRDPERASRAQEFLLARKFQIYRNLGSALLIRYNTLGNGGNLEEAITCLQTALDIRATSYATDLIPNVRRILASAFTMHYEQSGNDQDLQRAIQLLGHNLRQLQSGSMEWIQSQLVLASVYQTRYRALHQEPDRDSALTAYRQALAHLSREYAVWVRAHAGFGHALQERFEELDQMQDLENGIIAYQQAFASESADPQGALHAQLSAGSALRLRYRASNDLNDLDQAISIYRQALSNSEENSPLWPLLKAELGDALRARYDRLSQPIDLDDANQELEQALRQVHEKDLLFALLQFYRSTVLTRQFHADKQPSKLDDAISALKESLAVDLGALVATTERDSVADLLYSFYSPAAATWHGSLADLLYFRYELTGDIRDLEQALAGYQNAIVKLPFASPAWTSMQADLAQVLLSHFWHTRNPSSLDAAIDACTSGIAAVSPESPTWAELEALLGRALLNRAGGTASRDVLEQSIEHLRRAIAIEPRESPKWTVWHGDLGRALSARYSVSRELNDIEEAIADLQLALSRSDIGSKNHGVFQVATGFAFLERFWARQDPADLEASVSYLRKGRTVARPGTVDWIESTSSLGVSLLFRHKALGHPEDLEEGLDLYQQALAACSGGLEDYLIRKAAETLRQLGRDARAFDALQTVLGDRLLRLDPMYEPIMGFLSARTHLQSRAAIAQHPELLTEKVLERLDEMAQSHQAHGNTDLAARLIKDREFLAQCAELGISQAFAQFRPSGLEEKLEIMFFLYTEELRAQPDLLRKITELGGPGELDENPSLSHLDDMSQFAAQYPELRERLEQAKYRVGFSPRIPQELQADFEHIQALLASAQTSGADAIDQLADELHTLLNYPAMSAHPLFRDQMYFILADTLLQHIALRGSTDCLEEFIGILREGLNNVHPGSPPGIRRHTELSVALAQRSALSGSPADGQEALDLLQRAAAATPPGTQLWSEVQQTRAQFLLQSYYQIKRIEHLQQAIQALYGARAVWGVKSPERAQIELYLGRALYWQYEARRDLNDLHTAIRMLDDALTVINPASDDALVGSEFLLAALTSRHDELGQAEDLRRIESLQESLAQRSLDPSERHSLLRELWTGSKEPARGGTLEEIDRALDAGRQQLERAAEGSAQWIDTQHKIFALYVRRYATSGEKSDLDAPMAIYERILALGTADSPTQASIQNELGVLLGRRFYHTGDRLDLDRQISAHAQALTLITPANANWAIWKFNLGNAYLSRARYLQRADDFQNAISILSEAREASVVRSPNWVSCQNSLSIALAEKYRMTGDLSDLDAAIRCAQDAFEASAPGSEDKWHSVVNTSLALCARFQLLEERQDIDTAVSLCRTLEGTRNPTSSFALGGSFYLGQALFVRYAAYDDPADLNAAIQAYQEGTSHLSGGYPEWTEAQFNLGQALLARFQKARLRDDFDAAISILRELVQSRISGTPAWAQAQFVLGDALHLGYLQFHDESEQEQAMAALEQAIEVLQPETRPEDCLRTARFLGSLYTERADWANAIRAFETGVRASNVLYQRQLLQTERNLQLEEVGNLYLLTAYAQARAGKLAEAIVTLEQGRARTLSRALALDPARLEQISKEYPDTFSLYRQAVLQQAPLEAAASVSMLGSDESARARERAEQNRRDLQGALGAIRRLPGYADFFAEIDFQRIAECVDPDSALVYLVTVPLGTCALILYRERTSTADAPVGIQVIWRDQFTAEQLGKVMMTRTDDQTFDGYLPGLIDALILRKALPGVLAVLGELLASPIADLLRSVNVHSVRLVLMEQLGVFPLHAASYRIADEERLFLDEFDVSYIPSAAQLGAARARLARTAGTPLSMLTVVHASASVETVDRVKTGLQKIIPDLRTAAEDFVEKQLPVLMAKSTPEQVTLAQSMYRKGAARTLQELEELASESPQVIRRAAHLLLKAAWELAHLGNDSARELQRIALAVPNLLAYAEAEGHRTSKRVNASTCVVLDHEPTKLAVLAALKTVNLAHFACHSWYNWQEPLDSALLLSPEPLTLREIPSALRGFAGRLRLIVLSSCHSAIAELNRLPDELIGLPAGFLQAGVQGVLASLWEVNDLSTMLLMDKFYEVLLSGEHAPVPESLNPGRALAAAQKWLCRVRADELAALFAAERQRPEAERDIPDTELANAWRSFSLLAPDERPFAHPYYWAGFTFNGL